jgi:hypothetical protein
MDKIEKSFNKRAFVSIALVIAGLSLPLSGLMNHNLQFEQFTPERHFWMSIHNMSATLFCIFLIVHLIFNWHPLMRYIKRAKSIAISKEALLAIILVVFIVGVFSLHALHVK